MTDGTCRKFAPSCFRICHGAAAGLPLRTHLKMTPSVRLRKPCKRYTATHASNATDRMLPMP